MRFVFLTLGFYPQSLGGAYRYVAEASDGLAERGHEVSVIYPARDLGNVGEVSGGVRLLPYRNPAGLFFLNWREENAWARRLLRRELEGREGVLAVLCHAFFGPAAESVEMPKVFLFTGPWAEEYLASHGGSGSGLRRLAAKVVAAFLRRVEKKALGGAGQILTISEYYRNQLPHWHGELPPIRMISAGVDARRFSPVEQREEMRGKAGLKKGEFLWLTVRRLERRMGLTVLLEAFARVRRNFPQAKLWLAGEGSERGNLEQQVRELRLDAAVAFCGRVEDSDLRKMYSAADCTVLPSVALEGFGLAALESLACGTPVIGTRVGAIPEVIGGLGEECLFEAGSAPELAELMAKIMSDPGRLPGREECRRFAVEKFSWARPVEGLERAWRELAGERQPT